jgi:hypothetical protein
VFIFKGVAWANSTCAIVGNSGTLNVKPYGKAIDAHDIVIRMNQAPTEGTTTVHAPSSPDCSVCSRPDNPALQTGSRFGLPDFARLNAAQVRLCRSSLLSVHNINAWLPPRGGGLTGLAGVSTPSRVHQRWGTTSSREAAPLTHTPRAGYEGDCGSKTTVRLLNSMWSANYGNAVKIKGYDLPLETGVSLIVSRGEAVNRNYLGVRASSRLPCTHWSAKEKLRMGDELTRLFRDARRFPSTRL